jgi:uncharacterized membrane protein
MFRYGPDGFHHGPGVLGWLLLALLAALLILGVVALTRMWTNPRWRFTPFQRGMPPGPPIDPALTELRIRYARGDITWDDFSRRASNLGYPQGPGVGDAPPEAAAPPPQ